MYTKVYLTNPHNVALALSNEQFDNEFMLIEDLHECETAMEAVKVINDHKPLRPFSILKDTDKKTIFSNKDALGNIDYLVCLK